VSTAVRAGETPERGLRRELREELGLEVQRPRLMGFATDRYGPGGFPVLTVIYAVTAGPGKLRIADDVSGARWVPKGTRPFGTIAFRGLRRFLRRVLPTTGGR